MITWIYRYTSKEMHTKQHRRKQVHKACTIHDKKTLNMVFDNSVNDSSVAW